MLIFCPGETQTNDQTNKLSDLKAISGILRSPFYGYSKNIVFGIAKYKFLPTTCLVEFLILATHTNCISGRAELYVSHYAMYYLLIQASN